MGFESFKSHEEKEILTDEESSARLEMIGWLVQQSMVSGDIAAENIDDAGTEWANRYYIQFERAFDAMRKEHPEFCEIWEMGNGENKRKLAEKLKDRMAQFPDQSEEIEIKQAA